MGAEWRIHDDAVLRLLVLPRLFTRWAIDRIKPNEVIGIISIGIAVFRWILVCIIGIIERDYLRFE